MLKQIFLGEPTGLTKPKLAVLGLQHTFTMFGATILVPILTGLSVSVALFMAGLSTLAFHIITKGKVPIFLGSSFAFIAPIIIVSERFGMEYALGGVVVSGCVYFVMAILIKLLGPKRILSFFPPTVTGPVISIIGLMLAYVAINQATNNWFLAAVSFLTVAIISIFGKGFVKMVPILCGLGLGYLAAVITGNVDFAGIASSQVIGLPDFTMAKFNLTAITIVAPVAIATTVEHIGDMIAVEEITGKDVIKDPGLHRTLAGDGFATVLSALFGGPANTTYSENMGVLALTKVTHPIVMRIAACFAVVLGLFPIVAAVIGTIPTGVIGGVSIILFGMIAAVGFRIMVENKVDFKVSRNLIIVATIMVFGLGGAVFSFWNIELGGVGLAAIIGIILNKLLPEKLWWDKNKDESAA